jgi:hypothetical protein
MSTPCLSLHRVAYDPEAAAFCAEVQYLDATGIRRRNVQLRAPIHAGFERITRGLRDAAMNAAA